MQLFKGKVNDSYPSCYFFSEINGCYSTEHGDSFTSDGGLTWKERDYNSNITLWNNLYFVNQSTGFAYGNDGIFLKITYSN